MTAGMIRIRALTGGKVTITATLEMMMKVAVTGMIQVPAICAVTAGHRMIKAATGKTGTVMETAVTLATAAMAAILAAGTMKAAMIVIMIRTMADHTAVMKAAIMETTVVMVLRAGATSKAITGVAAREMTGTPAVKETMATKVQVAGKTVIMIEWLASTGAKGRKITGAHRIVYAKI